VLLECVLALYLWVGWTTTGRTVGKLVMGLRLARADGGHVGIALAFLRAALCVLFPIGLLWCALDRRNRSAQDLIVRTSVVYDWERWPSRAGGHPVAPEPQRPGPGDP
jgi:uncharacterized RDD family membrane protein YckC